MAPRAPTCTVDNCEVGGWPQIYGRHGVVVETKVLAGSSHHRHVADPAVAEIMAAAGFEWLVVDLEHSLLTLETAGELIRVIELCGASPLVRLTSNDSDQIKRVMDGGAHGIIVPMVLSADDAA